MTKVVINREYGGFGLSKEASEIYLNKKGIQYDVSDESNWSGRYTFYNKGTSEIISFYDIDRSDKDLIDIVELLGDRANDNYSILKIVEIPDDVKWKIEDYDGLEWVAEIHRTWK